MIGTEKQIKWAQDIIAGAEAACDRIIRDAEAYERTGDASINRPVKVEVAQQIKAMVLDGLAKTETASEIINMRGRLSYNTMLGMALQFSAQH